jgi:hypothetical protein
MELCDKTLKDVINEINENIEMKSNETLTLIANVLFYFILFYFILFFFIFSLTLISKSI